MTRDRWHLRANVPTFGYLVAGLVVAAGSAAIPDADWLVVHLLLLGAATNAIVVWSAHFTQTLLRLPASAGRGSLVVRIVVLNAGIVGVLVGVLADVPVLTATGAAAVAGAAVAHAGLLWTDMRRALPARFRPMVRYYVTAALFLPVGAACGLAMSVDVDESWEGRLLLAHLAANILGWMGITVAGTLVTLWPTMLRTKLADGAERAARRALPLLALSVLATAITALTGPAWLAAIGLAAYLVGWAVLAAPHALAWGRRPPASFDTWSTLAALGWFVVAVATMAVIVAGTSDWAELSEHLEMLALPLAAGFGAQLLLGALTYLVPVVLGGGPAAARATVAALAVAGGLRVAAANLGLAVYVSPAPVGVRTSGAVVAALAFACFLPLVGRAVWRNRQVRRLPLAQRMAPTQAVTRGNVTAMPAQWSVIVLSGGRGSRLGADKADVDVVGRSSVNRILTDLPADVPVVVVGPAPTAPVRQVRVVREEPPGGGPVAGLAAGLLEVGTAVVAVVATDMPFAGGSLAGLVAGLPAAAEALVAVDGAGRRQPLCAAYRVGALRMALGTMGRVSGTSMGALLAHLSVAETVLADDVLHDIDTPEDLRRARELFAARTSGDDEREGGA